MKLAVKPVACQKWIFCDGGSEKGGNIDQVSSAANCVLNFVLESE